MIELKLSILYTIDSFNSYASILVEVVIIHTSAYVRHRREIAMRNMYNVYKNLAFFSSHYFLKCACPL